VWVPVFTVSVCLLLVALNVLLFDGRWTRARPVPGGLCAAVGIGPVRELVPDAPDARGGQYRRGNARQTPHTLEADCRAVAAGAASLEFRLVRYDDCDAFFLGGDCPTAAERARAEYRSGDRYRRAVGAPDAESRELAGLGDAANVSLRPAGPDTYQAELTVLRAGDLIRVRCTGRPGQSAAAVRTATTDFGRTLLNADLGQPAD
jgi:hypothetical protein